MKTKLPRAFIAGSSHGINNNCFFPPLDPDAKRKMDILSLLPAELTRFIPLLEQCSLEDLEDIDNDDGMVDPVQLGRTISNRYTPIEGDALYGDNIPPWGCDPGCDKLESRLPKYVGEKILLLGCSGLRLLSLACHLRQSANEVFIISVDTSTYIHSLWQEIHYFMCQHNAEDCSNFPVILPETRTDLDPESQYLKYVGAMCKKKDYWESRGSQLIASFKGEDHLKEESLTYLLGLIKFFGYETVKQLVSTVLILPNDWRDERLVTLIRENELLQKTYPYTKIVTYLSNIVSFTCFSAEYSARFLADHRIDYTEARDVLNNINKLNPDLALHVDFQEINPSISTKEHETKEVLLVPKDCHGDIDGILSRVWAGQETASMVIGLLPS